MTNEEKESVLKFTDSIVNHLHYVGKAQQVVKEEYGLDSEYDEETMTLIIKTPSISESLSAAAAKAHVNSIIDPNILTVIYKA